MCLHAASRQRKGAMLENDQLSSGQRAGFRMKALLVAALTSLMAMAIPLVYWVSSDHFVEQDVQVAVASEGRKVKSLLQNQFNSFELIARSVQGFIDGSDDVTAAEFESFVRSLQLQSIAPGLQGVGFARFITNHDLEQGVVPATRRLAHLPVPLRVPAVNESYAPIVFMEPRSTNEKSIGFDIFSVDRARQAAEQARDTGKLVASEEITLVQDIGGVPVGGFVLYLPVYGSDKQDATVDERRQSLIGWVDVPFRLTDVLRPVAASLPEGLQLQVFENTDSGDRRFLQGFLDGKPFRSEGAGLSGLDVVDQLDFGGRKWFFQLRPTQEYAAAHNTATHHWVASIGLLLSLSLGCIVYLLLTSRDRANALALQMTYSMRRMTADLNDTLDAVPDLLFEMDLDGRYLELRTSSKGALNMPVERMMHKTIWEVLPSAAAQTVHDAIQEANREGRSAGNRIELDVDGELRSFELSIARKQVAEGMSPRFIVLSRDITGRVRAERQIQHLAYFDSLTGLPNRSNFLAAAPALIAQCLKTGSLGAILMIDLDNFKSINDQWGHRCGDALLKEVAARIQGVTGEHQMVARFGGDEFIVLLTGLGGTAEAAREVAEKVCQQLLFTFSMPIVIDGREYYSSASMGIAIFDSRPTTLDEIIRGADFAMYQAKTDGRNAYRFFDHQLQQQITERLELEQDMRAGLLSGEFRLLYQPQVDVHGDVVGVEALCRWMHPRKGAIPPPVFIAIAESNGFIFQLGQWVLQTACETLASWGRDAALARTRIAVNVSVRQFHHPEFLPQLLAIIESTRINPAMLELELTESVLAQDVDGIATKMETLKALGVNFSLDDFGTGYSSLNYLKRLPLEQLKIDQSFVRDVMTDSSDASIVRTIITLGESLGLQVIAEGVEDPDQHRFLLASGCVYFQGYLFSKPLPEKDAIAYIKNEYDSISMA